METTYDLKIAGVWFRILSPVSLQLPECFLPFVTEKTPQAPNITIELFSGTEDILPEGQQSARNVFRTEKGIQQRYLWKNDQYFIRIEPAGWDSPSRLGIPEGFFPNFCQNGNWLQILAIERMLLPFNRVIIHASAVIWEDYAYLFVAQSGGGKSTQAALWESCGAEILNGDKIVLAKEENVWFAYGSPVAGSSRIYKNKRAPLAAIFLVHKSPENCVTPLSKREGFLHLYSNAVKSEWDQAFNCRLLDIVEGVAKEIPVYRLDCTPDLFAVQCAQRCVKG